MKKVENAMKYIEKYDLYIDDDLVVYRELYQRTINHKKAPCCFLVQVKWTQLWNGYLYYRALLNGKLTSIYLHRLIAEVFIPNPENKPCVDHINGNRMDNRIENLRWVTYSENARNRKNSLPDTPELERRRAYSQKYYKNNIDVIRQKHAEYQRKCYHSAMNH